MSGVMDSALPRVRFYAARLRGGLSPMRAFPLPQAGEGEGGA
jgi:hypothetical protein